MKMRTCVLQATSLSIALALSIPARAQEAIPEMATIDHLVYAVPDLDAASGAIAKATDITPTPGGAHPGRGTANALMSLGKRTYLEIIGPDLAESGRPAARKFAALDAAEILTYAVERADLESIEAKAKALGHRTSGIRPGSRRTPSGESLEWRSMLVPSKTYAGLMPFFIDWRETPHPGKTSAQGARLVSITVTHPQPEGLRALYSEYGIRVPVRLGNQAAIIAEIESGGREVLLLGSGEGF